MDLGHPEGLGHLGILGIPECLGILGIPVVLERLVYLEDL